MKFVLIPAALVFIALAVFSSACFSDPWKFIAAGDSRGGDNGVNTTILAEIAAEIVDQKAAFVVFPGDLVNGSGDDTVLESQLKTWQKTMQPVYDAGIGVYAIRGNHDIGGATGLAVWNKVFSGPYAMPQNGPAGEVNLTYSITHKNVFVAGFDEYVSRHRINQEWLDAQLAANTKQHVFTFGHEPAFKVMHADCLDDYPAARNTFWTSLKNAGSRAYFCGHDHFFDHARVNDGDDNPHNDVHQYVVGTAGAPFYSFSSPYDGDNKPYILKQLAYATKHGYVVVEIDGPNATLTSWERSAPGKYAATGDTWSYTAIPKRSVITMMGTGWIILIH